jgi:plasmid stabilization system protein ParE
MKYTVTWRKSAENDLAEIWLAAHDRQAVTDAANLIDTSLRRNPLVCGESRLGNTRVMFVPPLVVYFDVYELDRRVLVRAVWRTD